MPCHQRGKTPMIHGSLAFCLSPTAGKVCWTSQHNRPLASCWSGCILTPHCWVPPGASADFKLRVARSLNSRACSPATPMTRYYARCCRLAQECWRSRVQIDLWASKQDPIARPGIIHTIPWTIAFNMSAGGCAINCRLPVFRRHFPYARITT